MKTGHDSQGVGGVGGFAVHAEEHGVAISRGVRHGKCGRLAGNV